jgi:TRAP-type C4-dicarboxylate transport system permease small subunit
MDRLATLLSCIFGYMFLALSALVTTETIMRKLLNVSFQGADELGGYALAVGSSLAFSIALIGRAHIRIDLVHQYLPPRVQAVLNWLAIVLLSLFGLLMAWVCLKIIQDTLDYGSTAPTPWATPLIYPQGLWYAALVVFGAIATWLAVQATIQLFGGRIDQLNRDFHPKGAMEELADEMEDLQRR